jgi:Family of unknown function (DUF5681)
LKRSVTDTVLQCGEGGTIRGRNGGRLRPFVKGQSGNPAGRPRGGASPKEALKALAAMSRAEMDALFKNAKRLGRLSLAEAAALASFRESSEGSVEHLKVQLDRIDGPMTQEVQVKSARYVITVPERLTAEAWSARFGSGRVLDAEALGEAAERGAGDPEESDPLPLPSDRSVTG